MQCIVLVLPWHSQLQPHGRSGPGLTRQWVGTYSYIILFRMNNQYRSRLWETSACYSIYVECSEEKLHCQAARPVLREWKTDRGWVASVWCFSGEWWKSTEIDYSDAHTVLWINQKHWPTYFIYLFLYFLEAGSCSGTRLTLNSLCIPEEVILLFQPTKSWGYSPLPILGYELGTLDMWMKMFFCGKTSLSVKLVSIDGYLNKRENI